MKSMKITGLLTALLVCFAGVSCSGAGKVNTNCETGWAINRFEVKDASSGEATAEDQFVCFQVTLESQKVEEVWVNFGEMNVDEAEIILNRYNYQGYTDYSTTTYKRTATVTKTQIKNSENGWVKIAEGYDFPSTYLKISFYGGIKVNEVVLINGKGEKLKYVVSAAKMILKDENGKIYSKPYYTADEIKAMDLKDGSPLNFNDEQDKFDKK